MRIAIDIDSTLHHYWDQLEEIAHRRFGVTIPYADQGVWDIDRLKPEQLSAVVKESHSEKRILASEPYPGAVEAVRAWHEAGHFIHITSHRSGEAHDATERWLRQIGLPYDELYCSYDKISRCVALEIDVLVDDSPVNLAAAADAGIVAATIVHPWNARLVESGAAIGGRDWPELERRLARVLS